MSLSLRIIIIALVMFGSILGINIYYMLFGYLAFKDLWPFIILLSVSIILGIYLIRFINNKFKHIIQTLETSAKSVSESADKIQSSSQDIANGSYNLAASLEEMSANMEELSAQSYQNSNSAQDAQEKILTVEQEMSHSKASIDKLIQAIKEINNSSKKIIGVADVIEDIAFQTNILALNASVEAARAGEHGRGFAVVAEAVRDLAQRSAKSAKETKELILQGDKNAENGKIIANEVYAILNNMIQKVQDLSKNTGDIVKASQEQNQGISQVNIAISQIDKVSQENAKNAADAASVTLELASQVKIIGSIVNLLKELTGGKKTLMTKESLGTFMQWNDLLFSVFIDEIDSQHKKLFDLVNELYAALYSNKTQQSIKGVLDELVEYTKYHFKKEEELQQSWNYPELPQHKIYHEKLVEQVLQYYDAFMNNKLIDPNELLIFLKDWLMNHIQKHDRKYGQYIQRVKSASKRLKKVI